MSNYQCKVTCPTCERPVDCLAFDMRPEWGWSGSLYKLSCGHIYSEDRDEDFDLQMWDEMNVPAEPSDTEPPYGNEGEKKCIPQV